MRRLLLLAAVLTAAVLASGAQASVFGDSTRGSGATGGCVVEPPGPPCPGPLPARRFNFLALGFPGGAIGLYTQTRSTGDRESGIVRCIEVVGNHAVVGGTMLATPTIPAGTK